MAYSCGESLCAHMPAACAMLVLNATNNAASHRAPGPVATGVTSEQLFDFLNDTSTTPVGSSASVETQDGDDGADGTGSDTGAPSLARTAYHVSLL